MTQEYIQTYAEVDGDGSNNKPFQFPTIHQTDVKVSVDGAAKTSPTHYNIIDYTPTGGGKIQFTSGNIPTSGQKILIYRDTPIGLAKSSYSAGSSVRDSDLNNNQKQFLHVAQEIEEDIADISVRQRFFVSSTPPTDPINGAFWYDPVSGRSFVYYKDVDSPQWVEANPAFGGVNTGNTDITNLTDANIASNANISQSKLNLAITNSEVDANAAIAQSKLNLSIANADVASNAAIAQSKLATLSIGTSELASEAVTNAKVDANAAINASKISYQHPGSASVARPLDTRLDTVININDFIPLSVTDTSANTVNCATYINNAINALPSTGGTIIFPPGLYRLTSEIIVNKNAVILEGAAAMVVRSDTFGARFIRDDGDNNTYISVTNGARSTQVRNIGFVGGTFNDFNTGGAGVKPPNGAIHVVGSPGMQEHIYENLTFSGISRCMNLDGLSSSLIRNVKIGLTPEDTDDSPIIYLHGSDPNGGTDRMDQVRIVDCIIDGSPAPSLDTSTGYSNWNPDTTYTQGIKIHNDAERIYECIAITGTGANAGKSASSGGPTGTDQSITDNNCTWKWLGNKINRTNKGIVLNGIANTIFISKTSVIRCKESYTTKSTWEGEFLYICASEAERALNSGFNLDGTKGFITIDNSFSCSCFGDGITASGLPSSLSIFSTNIRFNTGHGINLGNISTNIGNISIVNPIISGNSGAGANQKSGIYIKDGVNNVFISGGRCGGGNISEGGDTSLQKYGIDISGTDHKHVRIIGVDVDNNTTGGIYWGSGGNNTTQSSDNFIQFCPGYSTGQTTFP